jgi:transposase
MGYRNISADMKQRALQLIDEGWEMAEVAEVLNVSSKSIRRWDHHYETHGRVDPPSALRGRPRIMNAKAIEDLHELIRETPSFSSSWRKLVNGWRYITTSQSQPPLYMTTYGNLA